MPSDLSARLPVAEARELTSRLGPALRGLSDFLLPIELQMTGGGKHWVVLRGSRGMRGFRVRIFNPVALEVPRPHLINITNTIRAMDEWREFGRKDALGGGKQIKPLELVSMRSANSNPELSGDCTLRMVLWRDLAAEQWQTRALGTAEEGDNWMTFRFLLLIQLLGGGARSRSFQELVRIAQKDLQMAP
jgi:hypothetical protein